MFWFDYGGVRFDMIIWEGVLLVKTGGVIIAVFPLL